MLSEEKVELESVQGIVSKNVEANSFELFYAIANKKVEKAQELLLTIFRQGMHPLQINSFLGRCFRTLVSQSGSKELSNPWFAGKVRPYSRGYNERSLRQALKIIASLDFALKDSGLSAEDTMQNAVLKLSLRKK